MKGIAMKGECMYYPPQVFFLLSEFEFKTTRPLVKEDDYCSKFQQADKNMPCCMYCNFFRVKGAEK